MAEKSNKFFKWALILFCIGRGLSILESVGLLVYDAVYNYNELLYGYENWQTIIFLAISVLLTATVIVFAVMTNRRKRLGENVKAVAITLTVADIAMLLHLTYVLGFQHLNN